MGHVGDQELPTLVAQARGFLMPGEEDFGIAPVEANACGVPVIAYAAGGALDTQRNGETGVLFAEQSVESLCNAVETAERTHFDPLAIRNHARRFDTSVFRREISRLVNASVGKTESDIDMEKAVAFVGGESIKRGV